jgi:hypothetical protein
MSQGPEKERAVNPDYEFVRDYSALNKAALEAGMTSAKEQSRFRYVNSLEIIHFILFFCSSFIELSMTLKRKFSFVMFHVRKKHENSPMTWYSVHLIDHQHRL